MAKFLKYSNFVLGYLNLGFAFLGILFGLPFSNILLNLLVGGFALYIGFKANDK